MPSFITEWRRLSTHRQEEKLVSDKIARVNKSPVRGKSCPLKALSANQIARHYIGEIKTYQGLCFIAVLEKQALSRQ